MNKVKKLANFIESELSSELKEVLVTQDNTGTYYLFGKYVIINNLTYYKVYCLNSTDRLDFSSLKAATAWCILHNAGKYSEANILQKLDLKLTSIAVDIAVHKNIIKKSKNSFTTSISAIKLQEDTFKRRMILSELNNYINSSKRIQDKNFLKKDSKFNYL